MNILLLASHAVAEYDDIRMFTDLGYDVFCPGGYQDPTKGAEGIRPGIPNAPVHPELIEACEVQRRKYGDPGPYIDWAKARLHDDVLDWADVIICHHFPIPWIGGQWDRIHNKRVIWRTCGQSDPITERSMLPYRAEGLEIVRYSPKERPYFESLDSFAGQDALIRFGKYPDDYGPWIGDQIVVGNVTQDMAQRGIATGLDSWVFATKGLPAAPAGKGSEALPGGIGPLSYPDMLSYLRHIRVYFYTGTRPASYTLGLIEAMLSGVPVLSIGPESFEPAGLFEGDALLPTFLKKWSLRDFLNDRPLAAYVGARCRASAMVEFRVDKIGRQWQAYLS